MTKSVQYACLNFQNRKLFWIVNINFVTNALNHGLVLPQFVHAVGRNSKLLSKYLMATKKRLWSRRKIWSLKRKIIMSVMSVAEEITKMCSLFAICVTSIAVTSFAIPLSTILYLRETGTAETVDLMQTLPSCPIWAR